VGWGSGLVVVVILAVLGAGAGALVGIREDVLVGLELLGLALGLLAVALGLEELAAALALALAEALAVPGGTRGIGVAGGNAVCRSSSRSSRCWGVGLAVLGCGNEGDGGVGCVVGGAEGGGVSAGICGDDGLVEDWMGVRVCCEWARQCKART